MNKYQKIKRFSQEKFQRITGVKKETFSLMAKIIKETGRLNRMGRPKKLSPENRLLMTLEYLREYRTYFHIATSYNVSESVCYENIKNIESILIKSKKFSLPKRKELLQGDNEMEVILVDATETPIERPKRSKKKP